MRFLEAESREERRVTRGKIGEEDEASMAVRSELGEHLEKNLNEIGIYNGEMSETLVKGERGEPFENRGSRKRVGIRVWELGMGMV